MNTKNCLKYRNADGKVWSIIYNHPLRQDSSGKKGRLMRRSLGTTDSKVAEELVCEMKELLSNESLWNETGRHEAETKYDSIIISAFYDSINPQISNGDTISIRENLLPLPSIDDGYNRILIMGKTGAGKTTLLQHLIDTASDKFPLTASSRGTVSDLEVIVAEGAYKAVVTFFSKDRVRDFVQECVYNAILKDSDNKKDIFDSFSTTEEGFRLEFIIGKYSPNDDQRENNVNQYLEIIIQIKNKFKELTQKDPDKYLSDNDYSETYREEVYEDLEFKSIVEDILMEFIEKFENINKGFLNKNQEDWPLYWEIETKNRAEYFESLRIFSGNYYTLWGQLLTPLVQGMRIQGPFNSKISIGKLPKLVYIDGQGLEHRNDVPVEVIPKKLENMFGSVDKILLVDGAKNSMTGSAKYALGTVIRDGYKDKLIIAFTQFEQIDDPSYEGIEELRKAQVDRTLTAALTMLKQEIGTLTVNSYEREFKNRCFYYSHLNKEYSSMERTREQYKEQLTRMFSLFQSKNIIPDLDNFKPNYDKEKFSGEVHIAIERFHLLWDMRFYGRPENRYSTSLEGSHKKEHWKRMWAFNNRVAEFNLNGYLHLTPVTELSSNIKNSISRCLEKPIGWKPSEPKDEDKVNFIGLVINKVIDQMDSYIENEMIKNQKEYWKQAFHHSGRGSALLRATTIDHMIYDHVAPLKVSSANWREFLDKVWSIVNNSIDSVSESIINQSLEEPIEPSNFIVDKFNE
ncbi:MAG: hypothetical protein OIN66_03480 [Candidatus Methanoperedens sp.]|nr:hypothetical protein [Candidatus Methanoperedens sp.]